ncbi:MAG: N-6 DNA methylase [Firmicutes bacterium]|nr:N-6 DNA methylase [Bacillota bacterium]
MPILTTKDILRTLEIMVDEARRDMDTVDAARLVTALWTLKVLVDNQEDVHLKLATEWRSILSSGEEAAQHIARVAQSVEHQMPFLSGVFTAFSWQDVQIKLLYRLAWELDQLETRYASLENADPLNGTVASAADVWLERITYWSASRTREFFPPRAINELAARLLSVRGGTIYDGTSGTGGMLIEATREARRHGSHSFQLYGQERHPATWALGQMNLLLHGLIPDHVAAGDVLRDPHWLTDQRRLMAFDYVLMSPPFARRLPDRELFEADPFGRYLYGPPSAAFADMAFVQHAIASLSDHGKAVVVQPYGALFRTGTDEIIRKGILEDGLMEAVIFLPRNLWRHTGAPAALMVLNKRNPHPNHVLLIKADEEFERSRIRSVLRPTDIEKICATYQNAQEIARYSRLVGITEIAYNGWNLNFTRYFETATVDSKVGRVQVSLAGYESSATPKVRLADIADIERGFGTPKEPPADEEAATHRLINLSDVDDAGIHVETATPIGGDRRKLAGYELQPGDVILSSRGTVLKVAVVPETAERLVASANFIVIRLKPGYDPAFLKAFLESPVGRHLLEQHQRGSAVRVLSHRDVGEIRIPQLPLGVQRQIAAASKQAEEELSRAIRSAERRYQARWNQIFQAMAIADAIQAEEP